MVDIARRDLFRAGAVMWVASACRSPAAEQDAPYVPPPAWPPTRAEHAGSGLAGLPSPEVVEADITELAGKLARGETTSVALVRGYHARIDALHEPLRAVLEVNPEAEALAARLDAERAAGHVRGPLHGIPILVKDNIDTGDTMLTTAGSLALADAPAPRDAFVIARLRMAGAIILGKTNLSEWANLRGNGSLSGWSARGGQCRNPYALDRSASGSSSGSAAAAAASLAAATLGSETDGSITSPASMTSCVGIKPTIGVVSRGGVIPISFSQDTVGPIARTVRDAALVLNAIAGFDPEDPVTFGAPLEDYTKHLDAKALAGARIGVPRNGWFGISRTIDSFVTAAIGRLAELGAVIVDDVALEQPPQLAGLELAVMLSELKPGLAAYLARRGDPKFRSLLDVIAFDLAHSSRELRYFGQELFEQAQARPGLAASDYAGARAQCLELARGLLDGALQHHQLDALVVGTGSLPWLIDPLCGDTFPAAPNAPTLPAVAGYPHVTVPAGEFHGLPIGLSFIGTAFSEAKLLGFAYAFEQATKHRKPPRYLATAEL
ncbi:MAG: amidase [Kofleriaceae bacterium]